MMFNPYHIATYKTPEQRAKEIQAKKHKATCAKNRRKRQAKRKK